MFWGRHDASLAAAELALAVEKATLDTGAIDAVGTTGHWQVSPPSLLLLDVLLCGLETKSEGSSLLACVSCLNVRKMDCKPQAGSSRADWPQRAEQRAARGASRD